MAKSNSSNSNEMSSLTSLNRKNSNLNSKTFIKHSSSNKLKIAHRTRSKCPIERNISDLEAELPDDLLLANQDTNEVSKMISNTNLNLSNAANDSLLTSASTPLSAYDPNDQIYQEFLNHLLTGDQSIKENESPNKLNDNDDANEDPDFTICLENYENLDFDLDINVPKKEVIELISDQLELFDRFPLVCDDYRIKNKRATATNTKAYSSDNNTPNHSDQASQLQVQTLSFSQQQIQSSIETANQIETQPIQENNSTVSQSCDSFGEFIPQFTDLQRKQLDEQLRNHVQLLTQMCIVTYNSTEYKPLSSEARNLLNVLDNLNKSPIVSNENEKNDSNSLNENQKSVTSSTSQGLLASNFEIVNLKDALNAIDELEKLNLPKWDINNGLPSKILEMIVNNKCFYNTNLIPVNKYKYSSQFTRSIFSDCEKILLIMGFNKFKHLPKDECCKCIKETVLAHRSCHDIRKQLNGISNSDNRQASLKELIKRQNINSLENFEFKKEVHYKSPLEQADHIQLPSMYTLTVERLKMANILKESKSFINSNQQKTSSEKEPKPKRKRAKSVKKTPNPQKDPVVQLEKTVEKTNEETSSVVVNHSITVVDSDEDCIITNDNFNDRSIINQVNSENDISILSTGSTNKRPRLETSPPRITPIKSTPQVILNDQANQRNLTKKVIEPPKQQTASVISSVPSNALLNLLPNRQQALIIDHTGRVITMPSSLFSPIQSMSNLQCLSNFIAQPQQPVIPNSNLVLPTNFNGTILYQPTIHIHTNGKNFIDMSKYKKLAPKK